MSQLSHAQFPLRRHPNLLVDHRRSRSAAVAEPRGANGEAVTGSGGRLHFGMVAGIKSERWPTSNRNPRPDCLGIRKQYPEGSFAALARVRLEAISKDAVGMRDPRDREVELSFWESVRESENPALIQAYLEKYPNGEFTALAEIRLGELR